VVIVFLIKRRKGARELARNTDGPNVREAKEQATLAIEDMNSASPQEVNGGLQLNTEERDYSGRLRYPNDIVDVGGRLRSE